jgi:histidinol-phosphate aminotransferase
MKARAHLESMAPYTPIEPFEVLSARVGRHASQIIKLDANENPYGPLSAVREALGKLDYAHIYPDPESRVLRTSLERFTGVPSGYLLAGAGADELIDLLMRVLLEPDDCVLSCPPTFGMYAFDSELHGARVIEVPRRKDFALDLDAICKAVEAHKPKILIVATPNNPDGSLPEPQVIDRLLELPLLVVLDEAYIEFAGEHLGASLSRIREVPSRANLVVLRTFSKWAGLAGLRVGYGAFPSWLLPVLWKAKQPYNVNVAGSVAAQLSLKHVDALAHVVACLNAERARLLAALKQIRYLEPYPTRSNFILYRVHGQDASALKTRLAEHYGIFIRYFNKPGLRDHIRISVGRPHDTDALVEALNQESKDS